MTPEIVRVELERAIIASGSDLAKASRAMGKNHAYLQQFVRSGKPKYLKEEDRALLVAMFGIDPTPLEPPKKLPAANVSKGAAGEAGGHPRPGDPIQDAREATIVDTWRKIPKEDQDWIVGVINGILKSRGLPPIAA